MIKVSSLTQIYPSGKGIFSVDFTVKKGEVFGYLGPNGAGKTTTIRNMLGFANATEGYVTIDDIDCRAHAASLQNRIGYLPGEIAFIDNMSGLEFLRFMTEMRGLKETGRRDELIERFQLEATGKIKKMSKGMKQKVGIVAAFMHDPEVYILDEPTSGLDPLMQNVFMELIQEEKKRGKTILMSSHIFAEVQEACDRVGIIRDGKLVAVEDVNSLNDMAAKLFVVSVGSKSDLDKIISSTMSTKVIDENKVEIKVGYPYKELFALLAQCDVLTIESKHESLEDMFMKYYDQGGRDHE